MYYDRQFSFSITNLIHVDHAKLIGSSLAANLCSYSTTAVFLDIHIFVTNNVQIQH